MCDVDDVVVFDEVDGVLVYDRVDPGCVRGDGVKQDVLGIGGCAAVACAVDCYGSDAEAALIQEGQVLCA